MRRWAPSEGDGVLCRALPPPGLLSMTWGTTTVTQKLLQVAMTGGVRFGPHLARINLLKCRRNKCLKL